MGTWIVWPRLVPVWTVPGPWPAPGSAAPSVQVGQGEHMQSHDSQSRQRNAINSLHLVMYYSFWHLWWSRYLCKFRLISNWKEYYFNHDQIHSNQNEMKISPNIWYDKDIHVFHSENMNIYVISFCVHVNHTIMICIYVTMFLNT